MSTAITLEAEDVIELHHRQVHGWGGPEGLLSRESLEAACFAPRNVFFYEDGDLVDCAAALMWHLCSAHAFQDGNKRVGTVAGIVLLSVNGVSLPDDGKFKMELISIMMRVADHQATRQELAEFLRKNIPHPAGG